MRNLLICGIVAAMVFAFSSGQDAQAQGVHLGVGGVHVDVGRSHRGYHGHRSYYRGGGYSYGAGYGGGWRGYQAHNDRHDASYHDFHPRGYERHYNQFQYAPAHYDYHSQGHFDYHH